MNIHHIIHEPLFIVGAATVALLLAQFLLGVRDNRRFKKFMAEMDAIAERRAQMVIDLMSYTWEHSDGTFRPDQPIPRPKGQAITERETAHALGLCRRVK